MEVYREARRPPEDVENLFECQLQSTFGCETVVHPHVHEQFEVLYCRKGGFELFSGGALTPFGPGDMVLIDPNEVHHTRSCTPGENEYQVVKFAPGGPALRRAPGLRDEAAAALPLARGGGAGGRAAPQAL